MPGVRRGAPALVLLLATGWASAQTPDYISSMSPYQVRAMSGTYAPTNGIDTMQEATPPEWSDDVIGIILAWSGGYKATSGTKLFVHGGGHNDSANNGIYVFDYSGTTRPTGWSLPSISNPSAVTNCTNLYADGRGSAVHTYDGTVYASHNNRLYRFGGSQYCTSGAFTAGGWYYDLTNNTWAGVPNYPTSHFTPLSLYDPATGKILVGMTNRYNMHFFRTSDNTWSGAKSVNVPPFEGCGAFDPTRGRGVIVGDGQNRLVTANFSAETVSVGNFTPSGATSILNESFISCFYDPALDVYWLFGGGSGSIGYSSIYEMNAANFAVTAHALSSAIPHASGMVGSYGRFVFLDAWRAIGLVADIDTPAYVIKLPGVGPPTAPSAPSALRVQ